MFLVKIVCIFCITLRVGCSKDDACQCQCSCSPKIHVRLSDPATNAAALPPAEPTTTIAPTTTTVPQTTTTVCMPTYIEQDPDCPDGFRQFGENCYAIIGEKVDYDSAVCPDTTDIGWIGSDSAQSEALEFLAKVECEDGPFWVNGQYASTDGGQWESLSGRKHEYVDNKLTGASVGDCAALDIKTGLVIHDCTDPIKTLCDFTQEDS